MKSIIKNLLLILGIISTNASIAQSDLSWIQKESLYEVADFHDKNKQHIDKLDGWMAACNSAFNGQGYIWQYAIAKSQTFKAIDKSKQPIYDSIPTVVITKLEIDSIPTPMTYVYFPSVPISMETSDNIWQIQSDLLVGGIQIANKHIDILRNNAFEKIQNSKQFTLIEYIGNIAHHEDLTWGNTIFIKKGLLVKNDLSPITTFFNNLHIELLSKKSTNTINLGIIFNNKNNSYGGLFKIKNGNLIGELHKLNNENDIITVLSNDLPSRLTKKVIYIISNNKNFNIENLPKNLTDRGVILKSLKDYSPPSNIYTLEIKKQAGDEIEKFENIDIEEVKKHLDDNDIKCALDQICVSQKPNLDLTFECTAGENSVSIKISSEVSLELTLKSNDGSTGSISIDKEGKFIVTKSYENK